MRLGVVGLVYRKEMRETLRDRRTLFIMIALPILLYPLLMLGVTSVASKRVQRLGERRHRVAVEGASVVLARHLAKTEGLLVVSVTDAQTAVRARETAVGLRIEDGFDEDVARGRVARLETVFSNVDERSLAARGALRRALEELRESIVAERLGDPALLHPFETEETDVSGVSSASAAVARVLGLFLVLMMLTASFYPAIDLGAGEKERGTLETLLVAPVGRAELVMGKYLTILTISLAAAVLNLVAMGLTFSRLAGLMPGAGPETFRIDAGGIAAMLALLIPLGALFSAASLALSAFARTYKEGMHYLTPLAVVVTPLALVASLPDVRLDVALALLPVTGSILLFRDLLLGEGDLVLGLLAFGSSTLVAAGVLHWCVGLFSREEILFRPASSGGFRALRAQARRRGVPSGGEAILAFAVGLALFWFLGGRLAAAGVIGGHVLNQILIIAGVPIAFTVLAGFRPRLTFRLTPGPLRFHLAALLLAPGLAVLLSELTHRLGIADPEDLRDLDRLVAPLLALPLAGRLLLLAMLPAVCEEVMFRGFILTGLRRSYGPVRAALLCGLLFGLFHLMPVRIPITGALGVVLAALALRGGSLFPAILCHGLYNGLLVGFGSGGLPDGFAADTEAGLYHVLVLAAAVLMTAAGAILLASAGNAEPGSGFRARPKT